MKFIVSHDFFPPPQFVFTFQQKSGEVAYNGMALDQFCVQRTSAYISQTDNHIGELTVRETLDFAAKCQGASENWQGWSYLLVHCPFMTCL